MILSYGEILVDLIAKQKIVPSIKVKVEDTTGACDAFYGALLSRLDGKNLADISDGESYEIFSFANVAGAIATTARGALDSLPYKSEIEKTSIKGIHSNG